MERRTFVKTAGAVSAISIVKPAIAFGTANNSAVRMGFIGCGNRGTGVISAMSANTNINIIALADLFDDQLAAAQIKTKELNSKKGFAEVSKSNIYKGSSAYLKLLENKDVDAVLISTPAYGHPFILEAAVAAGKHAYSEKPAATDVDGCKRILKVSETVNNKLSVVIGFQIRYATPYVEMVKRIQRGDIGELISVQLYYFSSGIPIKPTTSMTYDEARIRNHFHFNELSGGIFLDQAIHMIDVCNWAVQGTPLHAIGIGGKKGGASFGNAWTNYQVVYKYPNDVNVSVQSTQFGKNFGDVCARFVGSKGMAEAHYTGGVFIKGENEWDSGVVKNGVIRSSTEIASGAPTSSLYDSDKNKGTAFISSIESGNHLNQLQDGANSTLTAILGREAATRQQLVTWDELDFSTERIDPKLDLNQFDK